MLAFYLTMNHSRRVLFIALQKMIGLINPLKCVYLKRKHVVNDACMPAGGHVIRQQNV